MSRPRGLTVEAAAASLPAKRLGTGVIILAEELEQFLVLKTRWKRERAAQIEALCALPAERLDRLLEMLKPRQREALVLRFGLRGGEPHTYRAAGEVLGCSMEWVRQLVERSFRRIGHPNHRFPLGRA